MTTESTPRSGVLAGGNWLADHVKILDGFPPQDALANILSESWGNGGSPYNILKALAKLGATFPLAGVGLIGRDVDGDRILADCRDHGISTAGIWRTGDAPTSYSDVMTDRETGRRTFFHHRGANALLGPEHFDFSRTRAKFFHLGYLLLLDRLDEPGVDGLPLAAEVLRGARAAGMSTSVDCVSENSARFASIIRPVLPEVDVLFVNDFEAERLTRRKLRNSGGDRLLSSEVEAAGAEILAGGVRGWIVLHFPEGAYAVSRSGERCWQASLSLPGELIKGAAGAGDAFAAGVLYGLHADWEMPRSLELGVSCAGASLFDATCSDGILPVEDCLALRKRFNLQEWAP